MNIKNLLIVSLVILLGNSAIAGGQIEIGVKEAKKRPSKIVAIGNTGSTDVNKLLNDFYRGSDYKALMGHSKNLVIDNCESTRSACSDDSLIDLKTNMMNSLLGNSDEKSMQGEGGWNFEGRISRPDFAQIESILTNFLLLNIEKIDGHSEDAIEAIFERLRKDIR